MIGFLHLEGKCSAAAATVGQSKLLLYLQEEAEAITGISEPEAAAWFILDRPNAVTEWCIVKLGSQGSVLCTKSPRHTYRQHALLVCTSSASLVAAFSRICAMMSTLDKRDDHI